MYRLARAVSLSALVLTPLWASGQASTAPSTPTTTTQTQDADVKDLKTAVMLSAAFPGVGSMYAGNTKKGALILGSWALAWGIINSAANSPSSDGTPNSGKVSAGFGLLLASYGYGMWAGYHDAKEHNERLLQRTAMRVQPLLQLGAADKSGHTTRELGLSVRL